jgi:GT2 family glycosyltransferase
LDDHEIRFDTKPEIRIVEDYDLWLRLGYVGARFKFVKKCLAIYLVGEDSISTNSYQLHKNTLSLLEKHCFGIQTFTPHRDSLMRLLRLRVKMDLMIETCGSSKFVFVIRALKLFAIHPLATIYLFYMVVLKRKYKDA